MNQENPNTTNTSFGSPESCVSFEPLISAAIDGELNSNEAELLDTHLLSCDVCRQVSAEFTQLNTAVEGLGAQSNTTSVVGEDALPTDATETAEQTSWLSVWRLIPLGVAATLLACFAIAAWPNPQPANANQISPEQIAGPMIELETLNNQKQRDQNLMLRTLGMDLRAMKLEINQLAPESKERLRIEAQIDLMIAKVREFESNSN